MQINASDDLQLPSHTKLLNHQVAGHKHGILKHDNGNILKPLRSDDLRSTQEKWFYETISNSSSTDAIVSQLLPFVPKYYGILTIVDHSSSSEIRYLQMEDVADKFESPCIMDVKIGAKTYDPLATPAKIKYELEKYPDVEHIGFRIVGMRVYNEDTQDYMCLGRSFGKKQTLDSLLDALHLYFNRGMNLKMSLILCVFLHRLSDIEIWFSMQKQFVFRASSILFCYEGKKELWSSFFSDFREDIFSPINSKSSNVSSDQISNGGSMLLTSENLCENHIKIDDTSMCSVCSLSLEMCSKIQSSSLVDVRMIDFAHVYEADTIDANYLLGLRSLIQWLMDLNTKVFCSKLLT